MTHRQRYLRRHRRSPFERVVVLLLGAGGFTLAAGAISLVVYVVAVAASTPDINRITPLQAGRSSVIYAADGSRLGAIEPDAIRSPIPWAQMPVTIRRATVAIEDKRFYEHGGVDYQGIVRAALTDLVSARRAQGGSTIAQQLVRAIYLKDPQRNISRKIREFKLATELEQHHSKTWILWQYLNNVPYGTYQGRTALGVESAAQLFFSKPATQLTLPEAALLAGLPQAPSAYNPYQDPSAAIRRRNEVLQAMVGQGYIDQQAASRAMASPLALHHPPASASAQKREPYFFDYVQEQLIQRYGVDAFRTGGFQVHTTVDPKLQQAGRQAIANQLGQPSDPSSAVVSIDPATGYIRAMASSGSYGDRSFNLAAQGRRQPGSAFKVFVLTAAILQGMDPDTTVYNSKPVSFQIPRFGTWKVRTYDNSYGGPTTLTSATLRSDNTVYAQLDMDVGAKKVAKTANLMGITSHLDGVPSEGLGGLSYGVSPLEMASAYATLAAGGIRSTPKAITRVVLPSGKVDDVSRPARRRVLTAGVAYDVTKVLQENVDAGTGTEASFGCPAAGKTGTTDRYNDAWFVGYTPTLASSIWVGYPNSLVEMNHVHGTTVTGSTIPARIFHDYMTASGSTCRDFQAPSNLPHLSPGHGHYALTGTGLAFTGAPSAAAGLGQGTPATTPVAPTQTGPRPGGYSVAPPPPVTQPTPGPTGAPATRSPSAGTGGTPTGSPGGP